MPRLPRFLFALSFVCGLAAPAATAATFEHVADATGRALRLHVPDDLPFARGILIWGNGAGGDERFRAEDRELVAFARSLDFCVLATGRWTNFSDAGQAEYRLFLAALEQLAALSGRPELVHAPWLPIGHSNGGQMSYGLNALRPDRVIAIVASKGCCYNDPRPSAAALRTPGLLIAGQHDTELRRTNIRDLFTGNRPRGALWAWVEEEAMDHAEGDSAELIRPFIEECVRLRLPAGADPRHGPVTLRDLDEASGWLVEPESFRRGFAEIASYADYPRDRRAAGWLPNARLAALFRAFASYRKGAANGTATGAAAALAPRGAVLGYRVDPPTGDWREVEIFEGARSLGRRIPGESLAATDLAGSSGYAVFHAVVRYADGTRAVSAPRRILVETVTAPPPPREPVALRAITRGSDLVAFDWDPQPGVTRYRIEVAATSEGPWQAIAETTRAAYTSPALLAGITGYFRVVSLGPDGAGAASAPLALDGTLHGGTASRLQNISVRCVAGSGHATTIVGFTHADGPVRVLARGIGPALARLGVVSALADPRLSLLRDGAVIAENDDWSATGDADSLASAMHATGAFALDRGSRDSALALTLPGPAGAHSAVLAGGTGIALLELYDLRAGLGGRLVNLSARGIAGPGTESLIIGFDIAGTSPLTVLLRAAGPTLAAFGVPGTLTAPVARLFREDRELLVSAAWEANANAPALARASATLGAFAFAPGASDAALFVTLAPGAYTCLISGRGNETGATLAELYAWP